MADNITIVRSENGTGKTEYGRILRRLGSVTNNKQRFITIYSVQQNQNLRQSFKVHPLLRRLNLDHYYLQRIPAHVVFAIGATITCRLLAKENLQSQIILINMAELPDLTVFAQILTRKYKGEELDKIEVSVAKKLNVSVADLKSALEGHVLNSVSREGKTLQLHFSGDQILGLHLMLRGELVELNNDETPRFQILAFYFKNDSGFALIDLQKQATQTLHPKPAAVPDALGLDKSKFTDLLSKKRTLIKTLLMDQKVLRGIGNSYSDEILYHAGVSPFSIAKAIPSKQVNKIYNSIRTVLDKAIKDIAEANVDELTGELKDFMNIHGSKLKTTAKGETIKTEKISGRTTYYTDNQELFI